ncbi:ATP-binding protein [Marivirga harenae]|mgnify:CR=1 FL=1|uniref:tetratricopeptide repeat-containing sensor histidine kinase n=1 Tax=Marivirga harenae TaxID=2010992 RepID=UPI0026DFE23A|nr:ATP-binding protein [Marivirga harenae]WKV12357.1 ATP-binding protein [Marivirga harenae]|tara:strand:+ start:42573 stop:44402 length:1830 start_codon:yes stop_codon:yes gene_type:complete
MRFCWILFFILASFPAFSQKEATYLDSLTQSAKKLSVEKQLELITQVPYGQFVAEVEKAEKLFQKAEQIAIELNDSISLGDVVFKQGQLKAYQNKIDESLALSLRAIKIFEEIGDIGKAGIAYGGLGYNLKSNNLGKAQQYMQMSIKLLEEVNDSVGINPVYDNYGVVLNMIGKNDSALLYQKKSLRIKKALKDSTGLGYSYANIANTFAEMKNYRYAKVYLDTSLVIRNEIADNYGITVNYVQKAEILVLEQKYKEALENFKRCASLAKQFKYQHLEQYCYEQIANTYLSLSDYENAYRWKERFQSLKDSSNSLKVNSRIEELQIQFETEKKEKLLAEIQTDILTKEVEIKNRTNWLISAFGLAFLVSIFGFAVYKQQKQRNKQIVKENQLKEALVRIENQNNLQEQRLTISKDLHDNIGSQLTFIISSLDNLKYYEFSKDFIYPKFESIAAFTRSTITDLRDTIWAMNKDEITLEDLKSRITNFMEAAKASLMGIEIEVNFRNKQEGVAFNSLQGINVYRIIQEAVNNAIKHSHPQKITVNFIQNSHEVVVEIIDDGKGFDIFEKENREIGNGLNYMRKRAEEIEGQLSILNQKPGTKVQLVVPVNE